MRKAYKVSTFFLVLSALTEWYMGEPDRTWIMCNMFMAIFIITRLMDHDKNEHFLSEFRKISHSNALSHQFLIHISKKLNSKNDDKK